MAQRKMDTRLSYATSRGAFSLMASPKIARGPDEDFVSIEYQRKNSVGPDFDPKYFDKLDALIEENYGPIVEYMIVNG